MKSILITKNIESMNALICFLNSILVFTKERKKKPESLKFLKSNKNAHLHSQISLPISMSKRFFLKKFQKKKFSTLWAIAHH